MKKQGGLFLNFDNVYDYDVVGLIFQYKLCFPCDTNTFGTWLLRIIHDILSEVHH